ncbi:MULTISPECIES: class I SAM-dependent rRNA methyltransferase [unclassified Paenibacillus]|uniref:class I SAM-dependent rRNA methyltransferase n=1 Tax=unclassified Paenibacillus TaxID=185978 RepID=UPI001AE3B8AF|nr:MULTISPECIES: class I SAM-dependent rRNA methyltransferase [unclassified Paenibacillus]MBP1156347.1 23S rRNA (cytosine1962-C5)-methyltransferase [Paenibacillus sp. PvP091]MBP1168267.1 23S rRNA (cytosine1962-C5)-methyltransferase [Paenibacillus sp. PvR098]MBP2439295.1 23S rRNA (cytosine1962-C5)-methyltransferase [Paenibacillus sp. PvP052]
MAVVYLQKKRKKRLEEGHPWVFRSEIERVEGEAVPGRLASIHTHTGQFVAAGYYNPASQIAVRVVSYEPLEEINQDFFIRRLRECKEHRERFLPDARSYRLVYGEADLLPGLIVDKFEDVLVVQILTLGMEEAKEAMIAALIEVMQPAGIYERSDVSVRELEGLTQRKGLLYGECPRHVTIRENGLLLEVDIEQGQKTGYFFDQRENRAALAPLMKGWGKRSGIELREQLLDDGTVKRIPVNKSGTEVTFPYWDGATVLECFSHTGSFTLNACAYGAKKVTCLDISEHAVDTAKRNVELNGFEERVEFVVADAFDYLREQSRGLDIRQERAQADRRKVDTSVPLVSKGRTWDVVILDPPAFAKSRSAVEGACRGYKDINLHGMKLVNEGGYLVTASCSYHMKPELFLETIHAAAVDAGKTLRLIEFRNAGKDHPRILGVDEGNYLKFAIFEVRSKR